MILYIGNMMSGHGMNPTGVEVLGKALQEEYEVILISDRKNPIIRAVHIVLCLIVNFHKVRLVLMDTYSTNGFYYALVSAIVCRLFKIPYIPILHGGNLPDRYSRSKRLLTFILSGAKKVVVPSGYLFDFFSGKSIERMVLIPNHLPIENYNFRARPVIAPRILWVRSFHQIYNPQMAVRILKVIKEQYPEATMAMVGGDSDGSLETCRNLARQLKIDEAILFTGRLSKEQWINLSEHFDIFLNTSSIDNMPLTVMEAMALGLPIVSTNAGGIPFLLRSNQDALLVPVGDEWAMVESLKRVLLENNLGIMISTAARTKVEDFSWREVKKKWDNVLREIVK